MDPKLLTEGASEFERERLCIKVGEALGEDRTLVTIWEMGDIERNDAAMIVRVKDLVSSLPSPNESHCTDWGSLVQVFPETKSFSAILLYPIIARVWAS